MKKFEFTKPTRTLDSIYSGPEFYNAYKDSEFLRHRENIEMILSKGYELRKKLKEAKPGERVVMTGMWLEKNSPLLVLKTGENVPVENFEFTGNRLCGLVAAFAFENRLRFPVLKSYEAETLGLTWNNNSIGTCRLYLSAVSGSEHFYDQFLYWPLVCALRKLQLKKITLELVIKMAKIKNKNGIRMGQEMMGDLDKVETLYKRFSGQSTDDLHSFFHSLPAELKTVLTIDKK